MNSSQKFDLTVVNNRGTDQMRRCELTWTTVVIASVGLAAVSGCMKSVDLSSMSNTVDCKTPMGGILKVA